MVVKNFMSLSFPASVLSFPSLWWLRTWRRCDSAVVCFPSP